MSDQSERLRQARQAAGYASVSEAARANGWTYSTYAGHENGHRGIKLDDVRKYAAAFGVTPEWLLTGRGEDGRGATSPRAPQPAAPGFAEDLRPFTARSDSERRGLRALATTMAPQARHVTLYQLCRDIPALSLRSGDLLAADANPDPTEGAIVIAQVSDADSGEAETRIGEYRMGRVIPPYGESFTTDPDRTAIIGKVIFELRDLSRPA